MKGSEMEGHLRMEVDAADETSRVRNVIILRALPIATQTAVPYDLKRYCTVHPFQAASSGKKILGLRTVLGL